MTVDQQSDFPYRQIVVFLSPAHFSVHIISRLLQRRIFPQTILLGIPSILYLFTLLLVYDITSFQSLLSFQTDIPFFLSSEIRFCCKRCYFNLQELTCSLAVCSCHPLSSRHPLTAGPLLSAYHLLPVAYKAAQYFI